MKKINALCPDIREETCNHEFKRYSGKIPCTGYLYCDMCGTKFDPKTGVEL
jgi:hypothetical protein